MPKTKTEYRVNYRLEPGSEFSQPEPMNHKALDSAQFHCDNVNSIEGVTAWIETREVTMTPWEVLDG